MQNTQQGTCLIKPHDPPTPETLVTGLQCKVIDDLGNEANEEEECESMNIENIKNNEEDKDKDEEDGEEKLIKITLIEAKHYAKALHHFVIDNLNQTQLIKFADSSYRLAQAVNQMVDCSTKVQKDLLSYFPVQHQQNNDA